MNTSEPSNVRGARIVSRHFTYRRALIALDTRVLLLAIAESTGAHFPEDGRAHPREAMLVHARGLLRLRRWLVVDRPVGR